MFSVDRRAKAAGRSSSTALALQRSYAHRYVLYGSWESMLQVGYGWSVVDLAGWLHIIRAFVQVYNDGSGWLFRWVANVVPVAYRPVFEEPLSENVELHEIRNGWEWAGFW